MHLFSPIRLSPLDTVREGKPHKPSICPLAGNWMWDTSSSFYQLSISITLMFLNPLPSAKIVMSGESSLRPSSFGIVLKWLSSRRKDTLETIGSSGFMNSNCPRSLSFSTCVQNVSEAVLVTFIFEPQPPKGQVLYDYAETQHAIIVSTQR